MKKRNRDVWSRSNVVAWGCLLGIALVVGVGTGCQRFRASEDALEQERGLSRVFLTWQRDPTTTMTLQWMDEGKEKPLMKGHSDEMPGWDLPYIGDADLSSAEPGWIRKGLRVDFMADVNEKTLPDPAELRTDMRLGWNEKGLWVYLTVEDPQPMESDVDNQLWLGDSIELFVSTGVGSKQRYQMILSAGADPEQEGPRHSFFDHRETPHGELSAEYRVLVREKGYVAQVLMPWENLNFEPGRGEKIAFQGQINSYGAGDGEGQRVAWPPAKDAHVSSIAYAPLVLAESADGLVGTFMETGVEGGVGEARLYGPPGLAGEEVVIRAGEEDLVSTVFHPNGRGAKAQVQLPPPPKKGRWGVLHAYVGDRRLDSREVRGGTYRHAELESVELTYFEEGTEEAVRVRVSPVKLHHIWPSGMNLYRVELAGLKPGTAYRFRVEGYRGEYGFRTMPETLDRPIRLAMGGDTRHRKDWMVEANRVAMSHDPDLIVWGGDLAYANGLESNLSLWEEWFAANDETLIGDDGFITPVVLGVGNHEVMGGYYYHQEDYEQTDEWRERLAPYFYAFFAFPGQPGYNALDFGEYLSILMLDSNHTNPIKGTQTEWLKEVLESRRHVRHVLPVYHIPAYPGHRDFEGRDQTMVREAWLPLMEAYDIRVAFEHHDHVYKRTPPIRGGEIDPEGIVFIGDGAWGVAPRSVHDPAKTWYLERAESVRHVIMATLDGDQIRFEVYDVEGNLIDEYTDDR